MIAEALRTDFEVSPEDYDAVFEQLMAEAELDEAFKSAAQISREYSEELPYHHYGHTLGTARRAFRIAQERKLDHYSTQILVMAALWHDAWYAEPLDEDTKSKEHRSAKLAYQAITGMYTGDNPKAANVFAAQVSNIILGTNPSYDSGDSLSEILNMADLANLYDEDTLVTLRETGAFFIEELILGGLALRGQALSGITSQTELLTLWIGGARSHVEKLVQNKLNPDDSRTKTALEHIKKMTVDRVLGAFDNN